MAINQLQIIMKKHFYFLAAMLLVVLFTLPACSQKIDVPSQVQLAFKSKFPDATKVKWSKESETEFETEFRLAGDEISANFSQDGKWVETEKEITKKSLPAAVQSTLDAKYAGYRIGEITFTETSEGDSFYEMEVKKGKEEMILHIAADGRVLAVEREEDEEK